jgi:hypothetical protein
MSRQLIGDIKARAPTEHQTVATERAGSDLLMDLWLRHHLTQLYGHMANEPLPAELLALLEARLG